MLKTGQRKYNISLIRSINTELIDYLSLYIFYIDIPERVQRGLSHGERH